MLQDIEFQCGFCGEANATSADPAGGSPQRYVEDCQVCCRPNVLVITIDSETGRAWVASELEG